MSHLKLISYIAEVTLKSDQIDSKVLAELLRLDLLLESYIPPTDIAVLREEISRRAFLVM